MSQTARPIAALQEISLQPGQVALWWLGQAGFLLRGADVTILVDAFLSPGHDRLVPPAFAPDTARGIDAVLATHDHLDHLDAESFPALAAASPRARFIVPEPVVQRVVDLGIPADRVTGAQPGRSIAIGALTVHSVPAMHGINVSDAYSFGFEQSGGLYRFLGYVLDFAGARVFHAGDTLAYPDMVDRLRDIGIDIALLPINGRDHFREAKNLVGNMDGRDAAHVAAGARADVLIPVHFDMFPGNEGFPAHLVDFALSVYPQLSILIPTRDRPFIYSQTRVI